MIVNNEPYLIEFNVRMGDPECQTILPILETDLGEIVLACCEKKLHNIQIKWKEKKRDDINRNRNDDNVKINKDTTTFALLKNFMMKKKWQKALKSYDLKIAQLNNPFSNFNSTPVQHPGGVPLMRCAVGTWLRPDEVDT